MQITITGRHVSITDAMKQYAEDKLNHIVAKYLPAKITKAHIIMDVQKIQQIIEIELHGTHVNILGKFSAEDMYTAVDKVIDKIESQLIKHKEKHGERKHSGAETIRIQNVEEAE
jgi:putative sigma-54 modulation protein